jgi:hypothetical protein
MYINNIIFLLYYKIIYKINIMSFQTGNDELKYYNVSSTIKVTSSVYDNSTNYFGSTNISVYEISGNIIYL